MATLPKPLPASVHSSVSRPRKTASSTPKASQLVTASTAKTHLLALIDQVHLDGTPIVITKRGRPLVQLVAIDEIKRPDIFGCMKGTFSVTTDITLPEPDVWDALA